MNQRGMGFKGLLACIPVCLFAAHCDMPAGQQLTDTLGASGASNQTGKLQLMLSDEPHSFEFVESAIITITRIEVRQDATFQRDTLANDLCIASTCIDGACIPLATDCDDGDACTVDDCDPMTGGCSHTPLTCGSSELCMEGQCVSVCTNDTECDDGDPCTVDACTNGTCIVSVKCVSPDPCTNVTCNPNTGSCIFVASVCAGGQVCFGGDCVTPCGMDSDCDDSDLCTTGVCGPNFACEFTTIDCDDNDACTTDSCDPNSGMCANDAVVCATNELCVDGTCYTACVDSAECSGAGDDSDSDDRNSDSDDADSDDSNDEDNDSSDNSQGHDSEADSGDDKSSDSGDESTDEDASEDDARKDDDSASELDNNMEDASSDDDLDDEGNNDNSGDKDDAAEDDSVDDDHHADDENLDEGDSGDESQDNGDSENDSLTNKGSDSAGHGSFIVIFEGEKSFDLLDLQNGNTDLLADAEIPAGSYSQLRLIVTGGEVTLSDGRVFPLSVPSGEQTGIKLHFDFDIDADEDTTLFLDVDLSSAFKTIPEGQANSVSDIQNFIFHPSLAMRLMSIE